MLAGVWTNQEGSGSQSHRACHFRALLRSRFNILIKVSRRIRFNSLSSSRTSFTSFLPDWRKKSALWWVLWSLAIVGVIAGGIFLFQKFDLTDVTTLTHAIEGLNAFVVILLMTTLPIGGFSIALVYLIAGARFGPVMGGVVVAGVTAVHLLVTNWITRGFLRAPLERFMKRRQHTLPHVPAGADKDVSIIAALVPGLPYFVRNYLIALTDVPLRIYFWICLPIYVARSYVVILLGDLGNEPSMKRMLILGAVYAVKLSICGIVIWHLRKRYYLPAKKKGAETPTTAESSVATR